MEIVAALGYIGNVFYEEYLMMVVVYNPDGSLKGIDMEVSDLVTIEP